jgi:hypothetical protein
MYVYVLTKLQENDQHLPENGKRKEGAKISLKHGSSSRFLFSLVRHPLT